VPVVQRQVGDRDLVELEVVRCNRDERLAQSPVDRLLGQTPDEVPDFVAHFDPPGDQKHPPVGRRLSRCQVCGSPRAGHRGRIWACVTARHLRINRTANPRLLRMRSNCGYSVAMATGEADLDEFIDDAVEALAKAREAESATAALPLLIEAQQQITRAADEAM